MIDLEQAARRLTRRLAPMRFGPPVTHVYNPLRYAWDSHAEYLRRFGRGPKEVVLLGMNPGPFGMAQTGVPFGDVESARWLGIDHPVGKPAAEHPKRPVLGLDCPRVEVSGQRLWGAVRQRFGSPAAFFQRWFVANYCPLAFMEASGRNRVPEKLPKAEREPLFAACDAHLRALVACLEPRFVIGIGAFAEARARAALGERDGVTIGRILHPSPANPRANRDWQGSASEQLQALGVCG